MLKLMPLVLLLVAACGGPPYRVDSKDPREVAAVDASTLVTLDDEAKWAFELLDSRKLLLPDGRLKAQIRVRNKTPKDMHVQVQWTFKDDKNFPIEPATPFEHLIVSAGQSIDLERSSLGSGATGFVVQIKTAQRGEF